MNFHELFTNIVKGRVAVYIDVANLERCVQKMYVNPKDVPDALQGQKTEDLCWRVDYQALKEFFQNQTNFIGVRFYSAVFDTRDHNNFLLLLKHKFGYKLKTKPLKYYADHSEGHPNRKANFDVEIAVDAVDHRNEFDTFILFSGDCDFEYLIKYLRGKGKRVIVFSRSGHVAKELPPASNRYFDIIDFRFDLLKIHIKSKRTGQKPDLAIDRRQSHDYP